ncbi:MAG: hypothetical protein ABEJ06_00325 [Haloarculaceae archaeon]
MSTDTSTPFESDRAESDGSDVDGVHTGALAAAVRGSATSWGFALLMVVFTGISLETSVYTSVIYPAFFGLCAVGSLAVALGQTYSAYGHHRFERTHDRSGQRNA